MRNETVDALTRAFQKAQSNTFFLAKVLAEFQIQNNLDDAAIAESLGCKTDDLPRLGLCRCPDANQPTFVTDIDHLANRYHLNANYLANLIRQVSALHAMKEQLRKSSGRQKLLLAARDRDEDNADEGETK